MDSVRHPDGESLRRARTGLLAQCLAVAITVPLAQEAWAQDAGRGARLYLQLPSAASCVSCHGPDPSQGRNNLLNAADQPLILLKALNAIGVMGYLKPVLSDTDVADLAAYLGAVRRTADVASPVALWPVTVEFGGVGLGSVAPTQTVVLRNGQTAALPIAPPRVDGPAAPAVLLETDCPSLLAPAAECRVRLRAQPVSAGAAAATLVLESGRAAPWLIGLSWTARSDALGVLSADLPQSTLDFGVAAAGTSVVRSFRLINHGSAPTVLGAMTLTGPGRTAFRLESATAPDIPCNVGRTLAAGTGCAMRVAFAAGIAGDFRASLQWRGDATQPANLALVATVPAPAAPDPAPPASPPAADAPAGGGCSAGPLVRRVDPMLTVMLLLAFAQLAGRRRDFRAGA